MSARAPRVAAWCLIAATLLALLLAVVVNLHDEEISPLARQMSRLEPHPIPVAGNAYVALLGLSAPAGADPLAEGARLVAERDEAAARDPFSRQRAPRGERDQDDDARPVFQGDRDLACDPLREPCLAFARARAAAIAALLAGNATLIERYLEARRMPVFVSAPIADQHRADAARSEVGLVHALLLTGTMLDAQSGRLSAACAALGADGVLWRRALAGSATLGDKMGALRALSEDLRSVSELVAWPGFDAAACAPALGPLLAPLSRDEISFAEIFHSSFVPTLRMLASWPDPAVSVEPEPWPERHLKETPVYDLFYRRNASINRSARLYADLSSLAEAPTTRFPAASAAFLAANRDLTAIGPAWMFNPLGRSLVGRHLTLQVDYIAHGHGVAAYVALVRAELALKLASVAPADVPAFLERAGRDIRNPLDDAAFRWDPATRTLSFDPPDNRWRRWGASVPIAAREAAAATMAVR
ncbi:MAG TPA: hypothetical protein VJQ49_02810 [Casimicrobiaceae bacterium]|nr:hypothetical protein [Casimicrobiaceae bacterium]